MTKAVFRRIKPMQNKKNKNELEDKLTREIWLFEQWLSSIEGQPGDTQERIRLAYRECIDSRKSQLEGIQLAFQSNIPTLKVEPI